MTNLIEGIQQECNRCRELLKEYEAIGTPGIFGATMIKLAIAKAEKSIADGDVVAELVAFKELQEITG